MRRIENIECNENSMVTTRIQPINSRGIIAMILLSALFILPVNGRAEARRYVLDFNDRYFENRRGEYTTLMLTRTLRVQYPWVDTRDLRLDNVILVAKSRIGRGHAQLRVGGNTSYYYRIAGQPQRFKGDHRKSFDRVRFYNPSRTSWGPWQMNLNGTFKVRKIILITENSRNHRNDYYSWHGARRGR